MSNLKIGDKVRFLDAQGGGIVRSFKSTDVVMVEDEDGFEIPTPIKACVVVTDEDDARAAGHAKVHEAPPSQSAMERVKLVSEADRLRTENEQLKARIHALEDELMTLKLELLKANHGPATTVKQGKGGQVQRSPYETLRGDVIEVDLHIHNLVETTNGMDATAMLHHQLDVFRQTMQHYKHLKGQKIVFIHGKGEGVLRKALLDELRLRFPKCEAQDASFQQYGFGATLVIVH